MTRRRLSIAFTVSILLFVLLATSSAATAVTSTGANEIENGGRVIVRDSSGNLYLVLIETGGADVEVWDGGTDGSSWSEQTTNRSGTTEISTTRDGLAAAIDSSDVIHIVWFGDSNNRIMYTTYNTSTDQWSGSTISSDNGDGNFIQGYGIAVDSSGAVHWVATQSNKVMGAQRGYLYYRNNVGGSWNTVQVIDGGADETDCNHADISIDEDDVPVVAYIDRTNNNVMAAIGNANNATSFTLHTVSSDAETTALDTYPSIAVSQTGDHYVAWRDESDTFIYLAKHVQADGWTTWQSSITDSDAGVAPSLAFDGDDLYVFYVDDASDVVYNKYTGTWGSGTWLGETSLETGTYDYVRVKWAYSVDVDSCGTDQGASSGREEFDYTFTDTTASPDAQWGELVIGSGCAAAPTPITMIIGGE